jgi:hypothetical protein
MRRPEAGAGRALPAASAETALDLAERIRHAEGYPYSRPACCYQYAGGRLLPLPADFALARTPVIATGSNAAPARLQAKFAAAGEIIPVTRARLRDFAVVFASHFTGYGAAPATLHPAPGAVSAVWITWLTEAQLAAMHLSEGVGISRERVQRYDYVPLSGLDLQLERGPRIDAAGAYLTRRVLASDGLPIRFAEFAAPGCRFAAQSQTITLRRLHRLLEPALDYPTFMQRILASAEYRQTLFERLTPHTLPRPSGLVPAAIATRA